ncbi:hypothetical protein C8A05DRAFT_17097 [Staphylotrichum tortipilum]|uniref:tRNA-intron lyase n=1 Tax=Staphylotrichum tortipilum TaxID=2831512 RepID=A0AAN6MI89_9PEZI|nr:hypothetical protein C8A05DRAFT_17097 [Staphylotrichum longicolle]
MAETATITASPPGRNATKVGGAPGAQPPAAAAQRASPPKPHPNQIYALPAPIRTFPLPTFYPNNPVSLLHLVYAWLSQVLRPPPREPSVVHTGVWDPATRSVHVIDPASVRALWEQGFYGKGSLSRSEPNWLTRELARRGSPEGKTVSEARTELRREERRLAKWERAKAELEALEKQRLAEATAHAVATEASTAVIVDEPVHATEEISGTEAGVDAVSIEQALRPNGHHETHQPESKPPVGPAELPPLSNSLVEQDNVQDARPSESPLEASPEWMALVGPAELLALPNSLVKQSRPPNGVSSEQPRKYLEQKAPVGPAELLLLPNSHADLVTRPVSGLAAFEIGQAALGQPMVRSDTTTNDSANGHPKMNGAANGHAVQASASMGSRPADELSATTEPRDISGTSSPSQPPDGLVSRGSTEGIEGSASKRRKSVRFSPTVESTTFQHTDPPSPKRSAGLSNGVAPAPPNGETVLEPEARSSPETATQPALETTPEVDEIENKEHFQLAPEEAFFLTFALGALKVVDPVTGSPISNEQLLTLFRSYSYFPPRMSGSRLSPEDSFLVHYAVYHHFRSLGWVPRHGIKFGVDWIIYQRGPVFDHSEFGIMVMPAYSDAAWEGHAHQEHKRSWSWLMGVNRVLSHVLKSLVLVYVDIPPPEVFEKEMRAGGIAAALKKYTVREVMVRRFSVNRNR